MKITVQDIMAKKPCSTYPVDRVSELFAGERVIELAEILDWDIPTADRIWGVTALLSDNKNRLFAADCVESVLHIYEAAYPDNDAPRKCIQGVRDFIAGIITQAELNTLTEATARATLDAARAQAWAARDVARATLDAALVARDVARATLDAAWAARDVAWAQAWAARDATRDVARMTRDVTWAALDAALIARDAALEARDAAWEAEGTKQIEMLKKYCEPRKDAE